MMKINLYLCAVALCFATATSVCLNNPDYRLDDDPDKSCAWIRKKEGRRVKHCKNDEVQFYCPQSCGQCCEDDDNFTFETPYAGSVDCLWVARFTNRQDNWCSVFFDGRSVQDACPVACDFCKTRVTVFPSAQPSDSTAPTTDEPTGAPTTSPPTDAPTTSPPTDAPTTSPPTDAPTDDPTCQPTTSVPTNNPSDIPSDLPSNVPSDVPTISLSPSTLPSASPTDVPSVVPSLDPTITCANDPDFFTGGNEIYDCVWVRGDPARQQKQCQRAAVHIACPVSCGLCCRDDPNYVFVNNFGIEHDCAWLADRPDTNRAIENCSNWSNGQTVRSACLETCNWCNPYVSLEPSPAPTGLPTVPPTPAPTLSHAPSGTPTSVPTVSPTMNPTEAHTALPTFIHPTSNPSAAPSDVCEDDEDFLAEDIEGQDCTWVRGNVERLDKQCAKAAVLSACPFSCGVCCRDLTSYTFQTLFGLTKDCAWIADRPDTDRAEKYCDTFQNGMMIRMACPVACEWCTTASPTAVPSESITPSVSLVPSASPSTSVPTASPSASPTYTCADEEDFRVDGNSEWTCAWVRGNEVRRNIQCEKEDVNAACPHACGRCCWDVGTYSFTTKKHGTTTCASPEITDFCLKWKNGTMVRKACPLKCNFCFPEIFPTLPTASPSKSPTASPVDPNC